jgi:hypothetical protein
MVSPLTLRDPSVRLSWKKGEVISVTSSDSDPGKGPAREPDFQITGARNLLLRADRNVARVGRKYEIVVEAKNASGNTAQRTLVVTVPGSGN